MKDSISWRRYSKDLENDKTIDYGWNFFKHVKNEAELFF